MPDAVQATRRGRIRGWRAEISKLGSADAMRAAFAARWPALDKTALRRIAILGAASEGRRLGRIAEEQGVELSAAVDDDPDRHGEMIGETMVAPVAALDALDRSTPVIIASHRPLRSIERVQAMGFRTVAMAMTLQVIDPETWRPHMFYAGCLEDLAENRTAYDELDAALADAASRKTLNAILGFRLTGLPRFLREVLDTDLYAPRGVVSFGGDEVYVEGGAYDGDTIHLFIERVEERFARIIGFEPGPQTHRRLSDAFMRDPRIEAVASGLGRSRDMLRFIDDGSRGARPDPQGDVDIPVMALDDYLAGDRVTFIKLNVAGAELDALDGARESIAQWAPTLAVSAYQHPSDLWRVPLRMREISFGHRLFLRQHEVGPVETVAYTAPPPR